MTTTTEQNKIRREKYRSMGLCSICGRRPNKNRKICEKCLERKRKEQKKLIAKRRELGLCYQCGQKSKQTKCEKCKTKIKANLKKRIANGQCSYCCRKAITFPKKLQYCKICKEKARKRY